MKAYTTIEESKQLIEAGLDVSTADMFWQASEDPSMWEYHNPQIFVGEKPKLMLKWLYSVPAWSLAALIDLIPNGIHWYLDENGLTIAEVDYYEDGKEVYIFRELYRNPVDAIVWLLENNYIKSNKNE